MTSSLHCVVNPNTDEDQYGDLFGYVCGKFPKLCAGISANGQKGTYGAYGMCDSSEQLSFVFNQYYLSQGSDSSACDFKGAAKVQTPRSGGNNCQALIAEAGKGGTGTVTSSPSGTGASGGGSSSSSGAAALASVPSMESGLLPMAFIITLAALSGMGMMLL
jgi:1,3-beta-glucanosyltransferase GAS1